MSIIRDAAELNRITVKIHNMKRSASRDSPSRVSHSSRSRSLVMGRGAYDNGGGVPGDSPERISPERLRRRVGRSPSPRGRYGGSSPHRDEYIRGPPTSSERPSYKVLCVSALHPKASDEFIKETLYREYKKFGDFSIRISHDLDERVAYVCFRTAEDAREAKHHKPRIVLYDKVALVEPVYESSGRTEHRPRGRSITPPDYDRYHYSRVPVPPPGPPEHRRPPLDAYDRYGPPHLPPHPHSREYRPIHHEYPMPPRGPPMHRGPPHLHGPPPHYPPRHIGPRPHVPYEKPENKKDKFPNYLHHVQPEDDPLSTRTLFAGNLEVTISDDELRRIFGKYGIVDDIDIKRPPPGTGNAFAFVRYQNLDMAHRAKCELSGQYIGKFQCKIGYGKVTPATRIWIGGLGAWTSVTQLEREFDRFGAIKKIEYQKGDTCAYIQYETIEAATAAVKEMRGFPLGGPERRLRTDFSELPGVTPTATPFKPKTYEEVASTSAITSAEYRRPEYDYHYEDSHHHHPPHHHYVPRGGYAPYPPRGAYRGRGGYRGRGRGSYHYHNDVHRPVHPNVLSSTSTVPVPPPAGVEDEWRRPPGESNFDRARSGSRELRSERSRSRSPLKRAHSPGSDSDSSQHRISGSLASVRTLPDVARKCTIVWQGALILKSSLFPAKFHLTDGDSDIVESLMRDEDGKHNLRITQRLRLDPPKLEDVQKRISSSSSHAIFLGLAGSTSVANISEDSSVQTRPLRNLVSYLKQKEAAGVISLLNKETEATGVLYAFPPCDFSSDLLKRTCSAITEEALKEDHLVVVVVRGVVIPTYILGPNQKNVLQYYENIANGEICSNLTYLGKRGLYILTNGIKIAYLSGIEKTSDCQDEDFYFQIDDVESVRTSCLAKRSAPNDYRGIDILLTSQWPYGASKENKNSSKLISYLCKDIKPRYHFCALNNSYFEPPPYRMPSDEITQLELCTRLISLAEVGNVNKEKYIYALGLIAVDKMRIMDLIQKTTNETICPYADLNYNDVKKTKSENTQYFFDIDSKNGTNNRKRAADDLKNKKSKVPHWDQDVCWFCLSSPDIEKHLIISVGEHFYLALAKGPINDWHILILSIKHIPCAAQLTNDDWKELIKFKNALKIFFDDLNQVVCFTERNYKCSHFQVNVFSIDKGYAWKIQHAFEDKAEEFNLEFETIPQLTSGHILPKQGPYFVAELPNDITLITRQMKHFPIHFARDVFCSENLLNCDEKVDWKECKLDKNTEIKLVANFKEKFSKYDFTL